MPHGLAASALADDVKGRGMLPHSMRDEPPAILLVEVEETTTALDGALREAGIRLPQFEVRPALGGDTVVRLGDCNVRVGLALLNLVRDGLTLRQRYPEESVNAR